MFKRVPWGCHKSEGGKEQLSKPYEYSTMQTHATLHEALLTSCVYSYRPRESRS
jgi:hypothetical protein